MKTGRSKSKVESPGGPRLSRPNALLVERAEAIVREVIASLPEDLRAYADEVPVFYEFDIAPHWLRDGVEPDSLGLFSGPSRRDSEDFDCPEAPAITLFLQNLSVYCREEGLSFEDEVRTTYLHEFGHYLGLEEDDMDLRGLL